MIVSGTPGWFGGLAPAAQSFILLDPKEVPNGCAAEAAVIRLDGQPFLEVRSTAGAESITTVVKRGSKTLLQLAQNLAIDPSNIAAKQLVSGSFIVLSNKASPWAGWGC